MDEQSRQRLGELAGELDGLLDPCPNGRPEDRPDETDTATELQCLLHLADGFVDVLLHEVERERAAISASLGT